MNSGGGDGEQLEGSARNKNNNKIARARPSWELGLSTITDANYELEQ